MSLLTELRTLPAQTPAPSAADNALSGVWVREAGRMVLAEVAGPLDVERTPSLLHQLLPLCRSSRRVVLDLRRAEFIDSTGVRGLLSLQKAIEEADGQFRLVTAQHSQVRRILKLLAIDSRFALFESGIDAWITRWDDAPNG